MIDGIHILMQNRTMKPLPTALSGAERVLGGLSNQGTM
jgi:hypothetical protein